jgi:hypothetical protein
MTTQTIKPKQRDYTYFLWLWRVELESGVEREEQILESVQKLIMVATG